jgi:hypothetical protein
MTGNECTAVTGISCPALGPLSTTCVQPRCKPQKVRLQGKTSSKVRRGEGLEYAGFDASLHTTSPCHSIPLLVHIQQAKTPSCHMCHVMQQARPSHGNAKPSRSMCLMMRQLPLGMWTCKWVCQACEYLNVATQGCNCNWSTPCSWTLITPQRSIYQPESSRS